jgi:hypothetical protein
MDFDLPGRIKNTRLLYSHPLLPLFEAVINSIHAVDEVPMLNGLMMRSITPQTQVAMSVARGVGFTTVAFEFSTHFHSLTKPPQSHQLPQSPRLPPLPFESAPPHSNNLFSKHKTLLTNSN